MLVNACHEKIPFSPYAQLINMKTIKSPTARLDCSRQRHADRFMLERCSGRSGSPIKLDGKRSQSQANHAEVDQPAKIRDEPNDGEDQQTDQESQNPITL